jgi:hypothetical protein
MRLAEFHWKAQTSSRLAWLYCCQPGARKKCHSRNSPEIEFDLAVDAVANIGASVPALNRLRARGDASHQRGQGQRAKQFPHMSLLLVSKRRHGAPDL